MRGLKLPNRLMIISAFLMFLLSGCQSIYSVFPPSTDFHFKVSDHLNPDMDGRPSPVVVKVYELASRTRFINQDFFVLYDSPESVLGVDLLKTEELEFQPGERLEHKMTLSPAARYVAIVVAYRDIEKARWKALVEVDPTDYENLYVYMDELAVYIREHDLDFDRKEEQQVASSEEESDLEIPEEVKKAAEEVDVETIESATGKDLATEAKGLINSKI
jgi:type VI secretion system protein VasD